jgi:hypothetical protein
MTRLLDPKQAAEMIRHLQAIERRKARVTAAIERYPHITQRICALWGHPELKDYLEGLVMIETNRDDRQGFPLPVQEELMALHQLIIDHPRLLRFKSLKATAPAPSLPFSFTR